MTDIDKYITLLDCNENFRNHIKDYIEIFVDYYGEDQREYIEKTFNSAFFVGYLTEYNFEKIFRELRKCERLVGEESDFEKKYEKYFHILNSNMELRRKLHRKYSEQYLQIVLDIIPESFKESAQDVLNGTRDIYTLDESVLSLLGTHSVLDYFSQENSDRLDSILTSSSQLEKIKSKRIDYFKLMGIDLGDDYEAYSEEVSKVQDRIIEVLQERQRLKDSYLREYYDNMLPQKKILEEAKIRGFLDVDLDESAGMYISNSGRGVTYTSPNVVLDEDGKYRLAPKVVVNFGDGKEITLDYFIIHELNHLYELSLVGVDGEDYKVSSGWDVVSGKIGTWSSLQDSQNKKSKRDYELFNETISEKISKEISKKMVEKGMAIFGEATEASYQGTTIYDSTDYLIEDFFETYKEEILASRRDNNIQLIFDAVGKENFDSLNKLFELHVSYFGQANYYNLLKDLEKGEETDRTRIYGKIKELRDMILERMKLKYMFYISRKDEIDERRRRTREDETR